MPVQKIDPKVIFASDAPIIDKPPVFSDKTKGWDVARLNDGRPTIKEMNKVQQDTDLKILWLNENSVTPYDESIDYPDGAVALKDGSFKQLIGGAWVEFLDDFANKDEVKRGIANRYDPLLTYNSGERVVLTNGDIVKSTIDGNTNDPNTDMTGWEKPQASEIFDESGLSQQEINNLSVTPFHFGAIGDGTNHPLSEKYATLELAQVIYPHATSLTDSIDWAALQSFLTFCGTNYVKNANASINAHINKPLDFKYQNTPTKLMTGDLKLTTNEPLDYALWMHGQRFNYTGTITIVGSAANPALRKLKTGLILGQDGNMTNAHINYVEVVNTVGSGVIVGQNCHFSSFGTVRGQMNGSGLVGNATLALSSTFSGKVNTTGDVTQRSTITVATMFPERNQYDTQTFISVSGQLYRVESYDRNASTLTVYPCLPNGVDSGTLSYIYGASLFIFGNNTANTMVQELQSIQSGLGFSTVALYGTQIISLSTEFLGIAISTTFRGGATLGSAIMSAYFEGNTYDIAYGWNSTTSPLDIQQTTNLVASKIVNLYSFRNLGTSLMTEGIYGLIGYGELTINGKKYNSSDYTGGLDVTDRIPVKQLFANTATYAMTVNEDLSRMFGKSSMIYVIHGSGSGGNPTGTITFSNVNGSSLVINGADYSRPIQVSIVRTAANTLSAKVINSAFLAKGTTAQRPASASDGAVYLDTTLAATNGKPIFKSGSVWVDSTGAVV